MKEQILYVPIFAEKCEKKVKKMLDFVPRGEKNFHMPNCGTENFVEK